MRYRAPIEVASAHGAGTVLGSLAARFRSSWEWRRAYIAGLACMAVDLMLNGPKGAFQLGSVATGLVTKAHCSVEVARNPIS